MLDIQVSLDLAQIYKIKFELNTFIDVYSYMTTRMIRERGSPVQELPLQIHKPSAKGMGQSLLPPL